jgi:hypothetical protein
MCRKKRKKENSKQSFAALFHLSKWAHSAVVSPLTRDFHIRRLYRGCLRLSREKNPSPKKSIVYLREVLLESMDNQTYFSLKVSLAACNLRIFIPKQPVISFNNPTHYYDEFHGKGDL